MHWICVGCQEHQEETHDDPDVTCDGSVYGLLEPTLYFKSKSCHHTLNKQVGCD